MGMAMKSEVMLGQEHMDCGMGSMDHPEHKDDLMNYAAPDCCENKYVSVETGELFKKDVSQDLSNVLVAATLASVLYIIDLNFNAKQPILVDTSPPLPDQDFQSLFQVFLI